MIDMNEIIQRLSMHEGIHLFPYKCSKGYLTIGIGRNLENNPLTEEEKKICGDWQRGITKDAAFFLLRRDIKRVLNECKTQISFWFALDDERQYALLDMAFNMGIKKLLQFKKMLTALGVGNYIEAAQECLNSKYAKEVGLRAQRIANVLKTGQFKV